MLDIDPTTVEGTWLRHVPAGVDPSWRPDPPPDNRWQRGDEVDALYLGSDEACVWAEWYRHLAEAAIPPEFALPRDLWRYQVTEFEVADLSDKERLAAVGLPLPTPGRGGWTEFQGLGEQLHSEGWRGVLAPSAARPASLVLLVFLPFPTGAASVRPAQRTRIEHPPVPPTGMRT